MTSYTLPVTQVTHDWSLLDSYRHAYREYLPTFLSEFSAELAATPNSITATSTSSVAIGTGAKTFTLVEVNRAFQVDQYVTVVDTATPTNWMNGTVTSYSGTTLIINGISSNGTGTKTAWKIYVSGPSVAGGGGGSTTLAALTDVQASFFTGAGNRVSHVDSSSTELGHTSGFEFDGTTFSVPNNIAMQADKYIGVDNNDRILFENAIVGGLWANTGNANITIDSANGGTTALFRIWSNTNNLSAGSPLELFQIDEAGIVKCLATTGAFIPNPLTTTQRDLLTPVAGMVIQNTTTGQIENYQASAWAALGGGGSSTFPGLDDVNASALSALRIPSVNAAGTEVVGTDSFRFDPATNVLYMGAYAIDSAGELRVFNTAMSAYSSIKGANYVPGSDSNGIWRDGNNHYYPNSGSAHVFNSGNGFTFAHSSTEVVELTSSGANIICPNANPVTGDMENSQFRVVVDQTAHTAQLYIKYSDGTFKNLTTALALSNA